ncbi:hypothetical protein ONS95_009580 [Cadophora gregata]|uniref:uncharacterized protein n=1 Tax=Cadophora gregata TaxID=51156 RepID=UPI0026DDA54B|nr:uncharacterized protein ONS95_009580 [Cadophora gregata]KAK0124633.1 hypothetical protein ONS95_009580 [Cadophora gregata]KAK0129510.1 hypothetical protein ONS96_000076 [Cadophora gregata f. sp. sojae]
MSAMAPTLPRAQQLMSPCASPSLSDSFKAAPKAPTVSPDFYLFSKLPLEIRLKIYTLSLPDPRLIPLVYIPPSIAYEQEPQQYQYYHQYQHQYQHPNSNQQQNDLQTLPRATYSPSPSPELLPRLTHSQILTPTTPLITPPTLLHTNQESRTLVRKLYTPCLPLRGLACSAKQTLYRPSHDILYFPSLPQSPPSPHSASTSTSTSTSASTSTSVSGLPSPTTPTSFSPSLNSFNLNLNPNTTPKTNSNPYLTPNPLSPTTSLYTLNPNLHASFTNFTTIHSLATPMSLMFIRRLAVSEDVFLEVEKARWMRERQLQLQGCAAPSFRHTITTTSTNDSPASNASSKIQTRSGGAKRGSETAGLVDACTRRKIAKVTGARKETSQPNTKPTAEPKPKPKTGVDAITLDNLSEFWDAVRRKFWGVEEVWILGEGMESRVLEVEIDGCDQKRRRFSQRDGYGGGNGTGNGGFNVNREIMTRERRMSFRGKIGRTVSRLEEETGWVAPTWRYLGSEEDEDEEEEDFSSPRVEVVQEKDGLDCQQFVRTSQQVSGGNDKVVQKHDCWAWLEARRKVC